MASVGLRTTAVYQMFQVSASDTHTRHYDTLCVDQLYAPQIHCLPPVCLNCPFINWLQSLYSAGHVAEQKNYKVFNQIFLAALAATPALRTSGRL